MKLRNEEMEAMKNKVDDINRAHQVYQQRLKSIAERRWMHKVQRESKRNDICRQFYEGLI